MTKIKAQTQKNVDQILEQCAKLFPGEREYRDYNEECLKDAQESTRSGEDMKEEVHSEEIIKKDRNSHTTKKQKTETKIGRYIIKKVIGQGGAGKVYKAFDPVLDRTVAMKVLFGAVEHAFQDDKALERLKREAKCNAMLSHDNIVSLYDFPLINGQYYLVMQYIEGYPLDVVIKKKNISIRQACRIVIDILNAMEYTHKKGIIHRDIKPSNILMNKKGKIYVTDFGIAKAVRQSTTKISQTGTIVGTPTYMSPEQAKGLPTKEVDYRTDIYSVGVVLYELITGKIPFPETDNIFGLLRQIVHEPPIPPSVVNKEVPSFLENICMKALEKKSIIDITVQKK